MTIFALTPETSDFLTLWGFVAGVIGCIVGIVGFAYTIYQVRKVKAAANAARDAATKTLEESQKSFARFVGAQMSRWLSELRNSVNAKEWKLAEMRALDIAELLGTLDRRDIPVGTIEKELVDFGQKFAEGEPGRNPKFSQQKWNRLLSELRAIRNKPSRPFEERHNGETSTDDPSPEIPEDSAGSPDKD